MAPPARLPGRRRRRLAVALSYGLNPLVFPPFSFGLLHAHYGAPPGGVARTFVLAAVFFSVVPLLYVVQMVRRGRAESLEIRDRAARLRPMLVGMASFAAGALALAATVDGAARPVVVAFAGLFPLNTLALVAITRYWKISLHVAALGGFVSVLAFAALAPVPPPPAVPVLTAGGVAALALLVPALMWARVYADAHTAAQTVAGAAFGLLVPAAELAVLLLR